MMFPTLAAIQVALMVQAGQGGEVGDKAAAPVVDAAPTVAAPAVATPTAAPIALDASVASVPDISLLFGDDTDEVVLARAAATIEAIDTLRASFVQTSPTGAVTSGTISMDRPGRLRFQYDAPSTQDIVATGGLVYVHDTDLETTDSYPVGQTPLRFLLSDSIEADGVALTGVSRMEGEVALALQSADDDLAGEVALVFSGTEDALTLRRWAVVDPQGGVTVVALDDVETGLKLSRRLFRIPESQRRFGNDRR